MDKKYVPVPVPPKKEPLTEDEIARQLGRKLVDAARKKPRR